MTGHKIVKSKIQEPVHRVVKFDELLHKHFASCHPLISGCLYKYSNIEFVMKQCPV